MILVYLYSRFGDTGEKSGGKVQYNIPVPNFPVQQATEELAESGVNVESESPRKRRQQKNQSFEQDAASSGSSSIDDMVGRNIDDKNYNYGAGAHSLRDELLVPQRVTNSASMKTGPPRYMIGTTANTSKRTVSKPVTTSPKTSMTPASRRAAPAPPNKVPPASFSGGVSYSKNSDKEKFKYFAYRRTSVLDHELPPVS